VAVTLAFACPSCGAAVVGELEPPPGEMACAACGATTPVPEAAEVVLAKAPVACPVCGNRELYRQKDFNRRLGLTLAAIGLLTGPFTAWISTVATIGFDAVLYLVVPNVVVCYACEAQQRGFSPDAARSVAPFDIAVHDAYKFGKRFPPRRDRAIAGPLGRRRDFERRVRALSDE
jgi:DNA-directed RNA polymerase subunit RPC12/RpoP